MYWKWDMFFNKFYVLINVLLVFLHFCCPISDDSIEHGLAFTNIANHFLFVGDFIFYVEFNALYRFRKYGYLNIFFTNDSPLLTIVPIISTGIHYYIKVVVYIGQAAIASNRLTSAFRPMSYELIWGSKLIWFFRLIQFLVPLAAVLPVVLNPLYSFTYHIYKEEHTLRLETNPSATTMIAYIDAGCSFTANAISLIMYLFTFALIRSSFRKHVSKQAQAIRVAELRLLMAALIPFTVFTLNTILQIVKLFFTDSSTNILLLSAISWVKTCFILIFLAI